MKKELRFVLFIVLLLGAGLTFWMSGEKESSPEKSSPPPAFNLIFTDETTGEEFNFLTRDQIEASSWRVSLRMKGHPDTYFASIMPPMPSGGINECMIMFKTYNQDGSEGALTKPEPVWYFSPIRFKDGRTFSYENGVIALHRRS